MTVPALKKLLRIVVAYAVMLLVVAPAWAAPLTNLEYQDPEPVAPPDISGVLLRLVISLIVVIGLAVIGIKFLQKRALVTQTGRWIRILDQVGIGPNKALLLSEIAGRIYVLGVTDHCISKLLEIEETSQVAAILEESLEAGIPSGQGGILTGLWKKPFRQMFITKKNEPFDDGEGE